MLSHDYYRHWCGCWAGQCWPGPGRHESGREALTVRALPFILLRDTFKDVLLSPAGSPIYPASRPFCSGSGTVVVCRTLQAAAMACHDVTLIVSVADDRAQSQGHQAYSRHGGQAVWHAEERGERRGAIAWTEGDSP